MNQLTERTGARVSSFGHWLRERFIRENLFNALKTFAWLGPLTLLIWVYAERAQVVEENDVSIPIEVQSSDRSRFVRLDQPAPNKVVIVRLSGPRSRVDELRQQLNPQNNPSVILPIDPTLPAGQSHDLDAALLINHSRIFESSGVSVTDCKPARVRVYIDQYSQQEVDIQAPSGSNLQGTPIFTPAKTTIRAPARDMLLANQGILTVEADLKSAGILDKPGPHEVNVRIKSPQLSDNSSVTYTPDTVKATVEVRPTDVSLTLDSVVITVRAAYQIQKEYFVEPANQFIPSVTIIGPAEQIAALQKKDAPQPQALLEITREDLSSDHPSHPLQLIFPPGIQNVHLSKADEAKIIDFKLVKRAAE